MMTWTKQSSGIITPVTTYHIPTAFDDPEINSMFDIVKTNVVDMNTAYVVKSITGTAQDFILFMDKASTFIDTKFPGLNPETKQKLLSMIQSCVFGYYRVEELVNSPEVSDIKIYSWDHITVKANGARYKSDITFDDEDDFNKWFDRVLRIQKGSKEPESSLQHFTDRRGVNEFFLRIDVELSSITSTECNNIHIRKIPKSKYSWDYLKAAKMLTDDHLEYIKDRSLAGYSFLISGKGGSGKSTLLNSMLDMEEIFHESILVSQESDELYSQVHPQIQFEHTLTVPLKDGEKVFELEDELRLGLLQDIDRFVIGEIKGGEALNVFTTAMSTGAAFSGTIHANDARSSVTRLAQCARYVSDYSLETLYEMMTAVKFSLIYMRNFSIVEIVEITGWDEARNCQTYQEIFKAK